MPRTGLRAPSHATSQSQLSAYVPVRRVDRDVDAIAARTHAGHLVLPADVDAGDARRAPTSASSRWYCCRLTMPGRW